MWRGFITEGPGFNVFALVDGELMTPGAGVLGGITSEIVRELAKEAGLPINVVDLPVGSLYRASKLFFTAQRAA